MRTIVLLGVLSCASAASADHVYNPFTKLLPSGQDQGIWLADGDHPGAPPIQITDQILDGEAAGLNIIILHDWSFDSKTQLTTKITPQLAVYGAGGHLFKVDLRHGGPAEQLTSGAYRELCSLFALDARPFNASHSFVQASVAPAGSPTGCEDPSGIVTWLIPASATAKTPPVAQPPFWNVFGNFVDPADGKFVEWVVWTGTELAAYSEDFRLIGPLVTSLPPGPGPTIGLAGDANTMFVSSSAVDAAGVQTDTIYRVTPSSSSLVGRFSRSQSSFCNFASGGSLADIKTGKLVFAEPTDTGYALYAAPLSGGPATQIYADNSFFNCGFIGGDGPSKGFAGVTVFEGFTRHNHVIGVNENGPATQTPVFLAGDPNSTARTHYTIDGHFWLDVTTLSPVQSRSTLVIDGDGTLLKSFPAALSGDVLGDSPVDGVLARLQREQVYLFSAAPGVCTGGTLVEVNPVTFESAAIDGLPADTCSVSAFGYRPASTGGLNRASGSEPVQIDPVAHRLHELASERLDGTFTNAETIFLYPFN